MTIPASTALPLMNGTFALAGESGSLSVKVGAGGLGRAWTYVANVVEHVEAVSPS